MEDKGGRETIYRTTKKKEAEAQKMFQTNVSYFKYRNRDTNY